MGTIADKLTYLNTTKGKIKDSINLTGANIGSSDTFRSYSAKLRDGLVDIINNGTDGLYNNFPKTTGTGSSATLNNTYQAPMKIALSGNTHQDSYSGKNLLGFSFTSSLSQNGLTITVNEDKTITINGTSTAYTDVRFVINNSFSGSNNKIVINRINGTNNNSIVLRLSQDTTFRDNTSIDTTFNSNSTIETNNLDENITYGAGIIRIPGSNRKFENFRISIMVTNINNDNNYEPFTNGASPNPDYPQDIEVVTGYNEVLIEDTTNIFNNPIVLWMHIYSDRTESNTGNKTAIIKCIPNTTYIIKKQSSRNFIVCSYSRMIGYNSSTMRPTENIAPLNYVSKLDTYDTELVYTTPENGEYLFIEFWNDSYDITEEVATEILNSIIVNSNFKKYEIDLGKNKFNISTVQEKVIYRSNTGEEYNKDWDLSDYIEVGSSKKVSLSFISTNRKMQLQIYYFDKNKNYVSTTQWSDYTTGVETYWSRIIEIPNNISYIRINYRSYDGYSSLNMQLEFGNKVTPYSPYKTPIEMCKIPNTDYKDEFRRSSGKQKFDKNSITWVRNNNDNYTSTQNTNTTRIRTQNLIKLEGGKTYTISGIPSQVTLGMVKFYTNIENTSSSSTVTTSTFTVPTNATYLIFQFNGENFTDATNTLMANANIQLEEGTQATDLEPYGVGVWYKYGRIGKVVLDGSESYNYASMTNISRFVVSNIVNAIPNSKCYSNNFTWFENQSTNTDFVSYNNQAIHIRDDGIGIGIKINSSIVSSITTFKTWLSTHNTIVYYILATPTITTLDTELQIQLEDIYNNAKSYLEQTNITAEYVEGNQPFIMDVSALLKEE